MSHFVYLLVEEYEYFVEFVADLSFEFWGEDLVFSVI